MCASKNINNERYYKIFNTKEKTYLAFVGEGQKKRMIWPSQRNLADAFSEVQLENVKENFLYGLDTEITDSLEFIRVTKKEIKQDHDEVIVFDRSKTYGTS